MSFRGGRQSAEEEAMQAMLIKMTMSINKQCFAECVTNFNTDTLSQNEQSCIQSCAKRQSAGFAAMNDIQQ